MRWVAGSMFAMAMLLFGQIGICREILRSEFTANANTISFDEPGEPIGNPAWDHEIEGVRFAQGFEWRLQGQSPMDASNPFNESLYGPPTSGDPNGFSGASVRHHLHVQDVDVGQQITIRLDEFIRPVNQIQ